MKVKVKEKSFTKMLSLLGNSVEEYVTVGVEIELMGSIFRERKEER